MKVSSEQCAVVRPCRPHFCSSHGVITSDPVLNLKILIINQYHLPSPCCRPMPAPSLYFYILFIQDSGMVTTLLRECKPLPNIAQLVGRAAGGQGQACSTPKASIQNWGELGYLFCQLSCGFQPLPFPPSMCLDLSPFPDWLIHTPVSGAIPWRLESWPSLPSSWKPPFLGGRSLSPGPCLWE